MRECGSILFIKANITHFSADLIVQYSLCVLRELAEQEAAAVDMAGTLGATFSPAGPAWPRLLTLSCSVSAPAWLAAALARPSSSRSRVLGCV